MECGEGRRNALRSGNLNRLKLIKEQNESRDCLTRLVRTHCCMVIFKLICWLRCISDDQESDRYPSSRNASISPNR